jgi:predicted DNA-binding transcriptional regulator AlpA
MNREDSMSQKPVNGRAALDRPPADPARLPRLLFWKKDLCQMLGVSLRTLERMISSGEIPPPNRRLRGRPAWLSATIHEWAASGVG